MAGSPRSARDGATSNATKVGGAVAQSDMSSPEAAADAPSVELASVILGRSVSSDVEFYSARETLSSRVETISRRRQSWKGLTQQHRGKLSTSHHHPHPL